MTKQDIYVSAKAQLKLHIEMLLEQGVFKPEIEIELCHYIRNFLKEE
jgi:hypothetical protein